MAKGTNNTTDDFTDIPHERSDPRPDFSTPPPRKKLPKELQSTLDDDEKLWEVMYEGKAEDTTDTNLRYAAYATRIRTIMLSAHRYVAYTSDIGESFRPIAHPYLVKGAYGVSWLYLIGDVSHEGYKAYCRNQRVLHPEKYIEDKPAGDEKTEVKSTGTAQGIFDSVKQVAKAATNTEGVKLGGQQGVLTGGQVVPGLVPAIEDYRAVMAQRAIFQAVASMGLPAFTIHSIVRYSGRALKDAKNKTLRTWGPIGLGLAAVPFLPYMFDEPVEHATEWIFYNAFKTFGGEQAVAGRPVTGAKELRQVESQGGKVKEL
ncbi:mitochondrial 18 KDa protein-domain-containing protein [Paraphoma chrysanthemicola]|uniref:Mitochondrial fission process protein 1 n=1 Tax=Paraphoma chrysanthemicola TaxID=798071 RepID=A0A8K0QU37_9PLEO|nr:mitochondrial 18 KDa protein-domain-containing protein [Paraphoma chrysanthemicola]